MVGGREYGESQLNRVTDAHRQLGSTFKPLSMRRAGERVFTGPCLPMRPVISFLIGNESTVHQTLVAAIPVAK